MHNIMVKFLGRDALGWESFALFEPGEMTRPIALMTRIDVEALQESIEKAIEEASAEGKK